MPAPRIVTASVNPFARFWPAVALAWGLVGCAATSSMDGASTALPSAEDAQIAGEKTGGSTSAKDASSSDTWGGGGGMYASDAAADIGAATPGAGGADQGIGLKPGGAQDIAFFRALVASGKLPKPGDMTLEGWLNEHDTVLPAAQKDRLVTLHGLAGVVQAQGEQPEAVLQLGLNSSSSLKDVQTSLSLTLVIDNSGSMSGAKIANVRAGLHVLADKLPAGTRLAMFTFSEAPVLVFPGQVVQPADVAGLHAAIDKIQATNGTNLYDGLSAGIADCESASSDFIQKRVMLLSDGQPTVGDTNINDIISLAKPAAQKGCSISTVGVGLDFSPQLMNGVAQDGGGTAWFLPDAAAAQTVFVQDLETMLVAVAQKLWLQFKPAPGWKVLDIYGFEWVEKDGVVQITGPKQATQQPGGGGGTTDPGGTPTDPNDPPVAMPTLFASSRNGLVLARLSGPASTDPLQVANLGLADITYGYTSSKDKSTSQFTVPVLVPGLVQIPDGGLGYFTNPAVRRAWVLLQDGLALQAAVQLAADGHADKGTLVLTAALTRHDGQVAQMVADLPVYDASAPDLADAKALLGAVNALLKP